MTAFDLSQSILSQRKRAVLAQLLREKASNTKSEYPLSYGQKALWFLHQSAPESWAYNTAFTVRICSEVDVTALKSSFQKLVNRHPALRTTFAMRNGETVQEVHGYQDVCFEEIDASSWSESQLNSKVSAAYQRPFNLEQGPVLRVTLFSRSQGDRVLLLNIHHIVNDGWSLWMLLEELKILYTAQTTGAKPFLKPVTCSYPDYIQWQTEMLASPQGEQLWNYWKNQLGGELPTLDLPTDHPRSPKQTYRGASCPFKLNEKLTQKLKEVAKHEGATLYMTLLAAFQVLLHRYTGQEDILVGSPTAGRDNSSFAGVVGYLVNPVVLRGNLMGNPRFKDFLGQMRQTTLDAIAHQDYPFPLLVERLQLNRDFSRSPLFQTLFVLQKPHKKELADLITPSKEARVGWGSLSLAYFPMTTEEGQFDLALEMVEANESLFGLFKYNTDLFYAARMTQMVAHFQSLLEGIAVDSAARLSELPLVTAAERQTLLQEWNNTHTEYSQSQCIHQLFETQVAQNPDAVAVVFEDQQLTYRELNLKANQLAHHLQALGVKPEVPVGICVERSLEMVVGLLGILKAGGAYVPLDPACPKERLAHILSDSQLPVVLTLEKLLETLPSHNAKVVCLDTERAVIAQQSQENLVSGTTVSNLAYTIYTSGSTGKPKGVLINHANVTRLFDAVQSCYDFDERDVWTLFHSYAFDFSVWEIWGALLHGGRLVVVPYWISRSPQDFYELLARERVTVLNQTPSAFRQLIKVEETLDSTKELSLRLVIFGGEALELQSLKPWFERHGDKFPQLVNMYGITETTVHVTYRPLTMEDLSGTSSVIGRPISDLQVYILDRHQQLVPVGVPGEMYVGGAGLALGYLNRPELTNERFIPHPFSDRPDARLYKSGDLARYMPNGGIEYLGRIDHQVKIRGFRIELGEIETVLGQHPSVREVVVLAREDRSDNKHLVAYVVPAPEQKPTTHELRRFLKEQLCDYMVPSIFMMIESLPLTHNGKIDRRALPAPNTSRNTQETSLFPPRDQLEQQLAQIWSEVLDVYPIGIRDDFFALGGHSLLAVQLMARIQQQFGKNLPLATLFQGATIEQLGNILRQQTNSLSWSPLVPIQSQGSKAPLFCLPGAGGNVIYFYDLARYLGTDRPCYGLQALGLDGESQPHNRIEDMATHYLKAIQAVQPQGPYFLAGHSSGGLVAFEMATQLQQQGHEVGLVAIFDMEAPIRDRYPIGADWDCAQWLTRIAGIIGHYVGKDLGVSGEALRLLETEQQLSYIGERLKMVDLLPPEAGIKQVRGLVRVFQANYQASAQYQPRQIYPTPVTFFRAKEVYFDDTATDKLSQIRQQPSWGWEQFSTVPVETHVVPGDHITMLAQPHVALLAEKLSICLERSQHC
ncbi:MAG: amino acid adenylation domain-containing protein [Cyanobacteria bacterium J06638_38]